MAPQAEEWIASSPALLAMTWMQYRGNPPNSMTSAVMVLCFVMPGLVPGIHVFLAH
jgi:hypothetical protein